MTFDRLCREVRALFDRSAISGAQVEARLLVAGVLGCSPSELILRLDEAVAGHIQERVLSLAEKKVKGWPLGRLLGEREFMGHMFSLNEATLEPRPDTEVLVLEVLRRSDPNDCLRLADIGTGTGAIAISLLKDLPAASCVAVDVSLRALECACANARQLEVSKRFFPLCADYGSALSGGFDWIISNPPYIRSDVLPSLDREVREHDPKLALDGGVDGLEAYRQLIDQGRDCLVRGGRIAFEIGFDQGNAVADLLEQKGFESIEQIQDLAGHDRVLIATWPGDEAF